MNYELLKVANETILELKEIIEAHEAAMRETVTLGSGWIDKCNCNHFCEAYGCASINELLQPLRLELK